MKNITICILVIALFMWAAPAFAAEKGQKGASARAYERASERAIFHRVSDWFATRGKSEEEKEAIISEREAKRAAKRVEKEAKKAQKLAEKKTKKTRKLTEKEAKKAQKSMRKQIKSKKK